mgnify:CR=1 FL=1
MNPFNNTHGIYDDTSDTTQRGLLNTSHANYMLNNFTNPINKSIDIATSQPYVFVKGGNSLSNGAANVDDSTTLRVGEKDGRVPERLNLKPREFNTIPFMGRGRVDPDVETAMMQSGDLTDKKSDIGTSEISSRPTDFNPLIPALEQTITNPQHLVEESADSGWIRGGLPSRAVGHENH